MHYEDYFEKISPVHQKLIDIGEEDYLKNDFEKIKKIGRIHIHNKYKASRMAQSKVIDEELWDIVFYTFVESVLNFNEKVKCSFTTFFSTNIWRAFYDWTRDATRAKRCIMVPVIDEKTGKQKVDKNGNPVFKPTFELSLDEKDEDGNCKMDFLEEKDKIEDLLFEYTEDPEIAYSPEMKRYLSKLSKVQRAILFLLTDGYSKDEIIEKLHITKKLYNDSLAEIKEEKKLMDIRRSRYVR